MPDPVVLAATLVQPALAGVQPVDPAALAAVTETLATDPATAAAPEAVPAAAVEPITALEPQPTPQLTPPPPQPEVVDPHAIPLEELGPMPASEPAPQAQPAAVEEQYQPEQPQYQPPEATVAPEIATSPAAATPAEPEAEGSWDWTWSCGGATAPAQPPAVSVDGAPKNWNWNWDWNCGPKAATKANSSGQSGTQYQPEIARYHPVNINVSIRIGSPGDDGPVTQTNVLVAVEAEPLVEAVTQAVLPATVAPEELRGSEPRTPAKPAGDRKAPAKTKLASHAPPVAATEAQNWSARPAPPARLQRTKPEAHRSRSQHRRPTRRPLPPQRVPTIPMSSSGAAPLGGSDGGGFQLALLLVPFALALVDSARRVVRDTAPPVTRERDKRRKRPG